MKAHVRTATVADAEGACSVIRRSITTCCAADHCNAPLLLERWLLNKTPANVRSWLLTPGAYSVVADIQGAVVGFAMSSSAGEVMLCYVVPEVRFTGVGKAMLVAIETNAVVVGFTSLCLESTRTAQAFYLRNGYALSGPTEAALGMEGQPMSKRVVANMALHGTLCDKVVPRP